MRPTSILMRLSFALMVALVAAASSALAEQKSAVSAAESAAIREVISDQIAAFRRDDGPAAFGYASPGIREMFGDAERFMDMVKSGYQPVYRPRHVEFGTIDEEDGSLAQHVWVTGPDGQDVEAVYYMEREPDGTWRINGCDLRKANDA